VSEVTRDPAAVPAETGLEAHGLEVTFSTDAGQLRAADGVSLDLKSGKTLGLVGESGCGKTVTGLSLLRLVPPPGRITGGTILLDGVDLLALSEAEMDRVRGDRIAMIFQEPTTSLNPVFTVGEQIAEVLHIHRNLRRAQAWTGAAEMLARVGIPDPGARVRAYPHQLSGGMRQRAMIAMALACRPEVLIADEPTTALDVTIQAQILDLMLEIQRDLGMAILFVSHNLGVISEVADDVAVMYAGRIVEQAPAGALFACPLHPYTRGLIETLPRPLPRNERLATIAGRVPDLRFLPAGCRFSDRCPLADSGCREAEPRLTEPAPNHWVACFKANP
jgi:oligopeptide/dipeptide ABC transporter ATP-binding protein